MISDICTPTGTHHEEIAIRILDQVAMSLVRPKPKDPDQSLMQAIGTIAGLAPQNATEAMLATQMIATHEAAMHFMMLATLDDQTFQGRDANVLRATRLMRLHLDQIEAMQKLKGKAGQQKVTVEHVHVYQGGQAIVGAVAPAGPGVVGDETENR
jgi:predicted ATPase